jgi:organic hydroperoxide reductase OsmC/OhrA
MGKQHNYNLTIKWTGNKGEGTSNYRAYERSYSVIAENKVEIKGSSDPAFRGDKTKYNPEEFLVAALSSCHMLSFLHVCAEAGITVVDYIDNATGTMAETATGGGHFTEVTLNPLVTITDKNKADTLHELHKKANENCFIASSVNFPVHHKPVCVIAEESFS